MKPLKMGLLYTNYIQKIMPIILAKKQITRNVFVNISMYTCVYIRREINDWMYIFHKYMMVYRC